MSVKVDIIEGSALRQTKQGLEKVRIARVTGLVGDASQREWEALGQAGVPQMSDPHPTIPSIEVDERSVKADTHDAAVVNIVYRTPNVDFSGGFSEPAIGDPPQIEIGATVQSTTTQRAYDDSELAVVYTPTDEEVANGELSQQDYPVVGTASVQVPQVFVRYTRRETASPGDNAKLYVGKVNSVTVFGDGPRMWLCTQIIGRSTDNGASFVVTYEFQRADDPDIGWDVTIWAEKDGKLQVDATSDNAKDFQVYQTADFNTLGLA